MANKFKKYNVSEDYGTSNNLCKLPHHSTEDESKLKKSGVYSWFNAMTVTATT